MARELNGKRIAILVDNGFEQIEMTGPRGSGKRPGADRFDISSGSNGSGHEPR